MIVYVPFQGEVKHCSKAMLLRHLFNKKSYKTRYKYAYQLEIERFKVVESLRATSTSIFVANVIVYTCSTVTSSCCFHTVCFAYGMIVHVPFQGEVKHHSRANAGYALNSTSRVTKTRYK